MVSNITLYLGIAIGTDDGRSVCAFIVSFIIRRLRIRRLGVALGLRVIGSRVFCSGILARVILDIVAILVLGILVSVAYTSRLT